MYTLYRILLCAVLAGAASAQESAPAGSSPPAASAPAELPPFLKDKQQLFENPTPEQLRLPDPLPQPKGTQEIITNYYAHIIAKLREAARKDTLPVGGDSRYNPPKQFAFEAIQHLNAAHLRRAAIEGARDARKRLEGQAKAEVDRQVEANVLVALQYYPLLAESQDDIDQLLFIIQDPTKDAVMRKVLLERSAPGIVPPSLLGDWLQYNFALRPGAVAEVLGKLIQSTQEHADIQMLAMDILYQMRWNELERLLASDSNVRRHIEESGMPYTLASIKRGERIALSDAVAPQFKGLLGSYVNMAQMFAQLLEERMGRPEPVRKHAVEMIQKILREVPLEDPAPVQALLWEQPA